VNRREDNTKLSVKEAKF